MGAGLDVLCQEETQCQISERTGLGNYSLDQDRYRFINGPVFISTFHIDNYTRGIAHLFLRHPYCSPFPSQFISMEAFHDE